MIKHKHQQLFDLLAEEFRNGLWPRGEKLPSQKELSARYSVSVNVVSQALELLKQTKLVKIKKGDGIYSIYSPEPARLVHKYSGERVFGRYAGAKTLTVLIEDHLEWQLVFWNWFFDEFSRENPDIELKVQFDHYKASEERQENYDMVIGGLRFTGQAGKAIKRLSHQTAFDFYPDLDDGLLLKTADFADGIFPVGFVSSYLLSLAGIPEVRPGENVLDYIERVIRPGHGALLMRHSTELFQNNGIDVINRNRRCLDEEEKVRLRNFFERTNRLHRDGRLLWPHGRFSDPEQTLEMLKKGTITLLGRQRGGELPQLPGGKIVENPYPHGEKAMIVPVVAVLNQDTCFVEEQLRLIRKLRSMAVQEKARQLGVFQTLHKAVLPETSPFAGYFARNAVEFRRSDDPVEIRLIDYIVSWELLFCMTGSRSVEDSVEMVDKKIRYYYKYAENNCKNIQL